MSRTLAPTLTEYVLRDAHYTDEEWVTAYRREFRALLAVAEAATRAHRDHPTTCGGCRDAMERALSRLERLSRPAPRTRRTPRT